MFNKPLLWKAISFISSATLAVAIMAVSLASASRAESKDTSPISTRRLYFNQEILPDHLLYPVAMVGDRARLVVATDVDERAQLQVLYAERRLDSAHKLIEKGESDLAITTLTKAQKYMLQAVAAVESHTVSSTTKSLVISAITDYLDRVAVCKSDHPEIASPDLDALTHELRSAADRLTAS